MSVGPRAQTARNTVAYLALQEALGHPPTDAEQRHYAVLAKTLGVSSSDPTIISYAQIDRHTARLTAHLSTMVDHSINRMEAIADKFIASGKDPVRLAASQAKIKEEERFETKWWRRWVALAFVLGVIFGMLIQEHVDHRGAS